MSKENDGILEFNLPQLAVIYAQQPNVYLEAGRGLGKSTILAWRMKELTHAMPRSAMVIVGETYQQILTRTLPSTISGLARLGYHHGLHYFIGRRPPASWKWSEPYEPPLNYEHFMIWYTGAGFHFVSQDRVGSGRGLNTDAIIGDEMQLLDYEQLFHDVLATNRGGKDRPFADSRYHHSTMFAGTIAWTNKGKWIYAKEELAKQNPKEYCYIRASSEHNRHNLGDKWFNDLKQELTPMLYNAEVLNIRPEKVEGCFYPLFDDNIHTYNSFNYTHLDKLNFDFSKIAALDWQQYGDVDGNRPFDIACDWGATINTLVVRQEHETTHYKESRAVHAMFVKTPQRIQDLATKFCDHYATKPCKDVHFYYDHTAIYLDAIRTVSFADEFMAVLRKRGWTVYPHYINKAASHHTRYLFWGIAHSETNGRLPRFRYNATTAKYLIISIKNAAVREGRNGFEKNKNAERDINAKQEETTHFSDADDTLCYGKYGMDSGNNHNDVFIDTMYSI
ncbi:hypothetical protein SAMN05421780_1143 [Flexibacter flexilis DSM 6793]|uniref:Uncharacterized protein n=1 Tax=Flexibacter flexilis DSM 6793 TaxID=927664 RepID=A0A1I1NC33_9BACT|nr:hypothetical protein [Flexibacter flexilis]SFC95087.1 hypothetical protein SAMN05421780_1143 [Flexibacter flexilis DSM 6793]